MGDWTKKIKQAEKFMETARLHGRRVYVRYKDDRTQPGYLTSTGLHRANLFYSNVNTLKESLFNSLPKADVSKLHKGDFNDDVARVAATIVQRGLDYELQCNETDFTSAVRYAILDRLVPGLGTVWITFSMDMQETPHAENYEDEDKEKRVRVPIPGTEHLGVETVYWEDFLYEPARTWADVGWVARRLELSRDDVIERWGKEQLQNIDQSKAKGDSALTPKEITQGKYYVYEIWDKEDKKVFFWSMGMSEPLEEKPDPYNLKDFFPCPPPLIANVTTNAFLPVTDYHICQDQYNELDTLYARMVLVASAIKVTGCYDSSQPAVGKLLTGQENTLIPVDNWAMYMEKGGTKGVIDYYPVAEISNVLENLTRQYDYIKGVLQEISGLTDIMRGDTSPYETAEAQKLKAGFSAGRMNGYQRDVAEFVSRILQIMAQLMCQLYSDQKLQQVVGQLPDYDMQFAAPAVQLLRNGLMSTYRVSIKADSLTQQDWAAEKGQRMELMGYLSQFLQQAIPAVQASPTLGPLLLGLLKFTISGYRGASEIEGLIDTQLDQMIQEAQQPKPPPPPTPEEQKAQADKAANDQKMQMEQQKFQMEQERLIQQQKIEQEKAQLDAAVAAQKIEHAREMHLLDVQAAQVKHQQEAAHQATKNAIDIENTRVKMALDIQKQQAAADKPDKGASH